MTFIPASNDWTTQKFPTKASVTYSIGMMMYSDGSNMVPTTTTTQVGVLGIAKEAKASSSTTTSISVLMPESPMSTFKATGCSGTLTKASEGLFFDFAAGGLAVAQGASTYDTVQLIKFIDSTTGIFRLNPTYGVEN